MGMTMKTLLVMVAWTTPLSALAAPMPKLTSYIESRVSAAEKSVQSGSGGFPKAQLQDINVDFVAQVGFGLSEVFHLTLLPELDLVFAPTAPPPAPPADSTPRGP